MLYDRIHDLVLRLPALGYQLGDIECELLEGYLDAWLRCGAPPQVLLQAARFVGTYSRGPDPMPLGRRAEILWIRLNDLVWERNAWWTVRREFNNLWHVIDQLVSVFAATHPYVVLATVLCWHYGLPLHWAMEICHTAFDHEEAWSGDMILAVRVRPAGDRKSVV